MLPAVLHPYSRGSISLQDSDPRSRPVIDPNLLSDPRDRQVMKAGKCLIILFQHIPITSPQIKSCYDTNSFSATWVS